MSQRAQNFGGIYTEGAADRPPRRGEEGQADDRNYEGEGGRIEHPHLSHKHPKQGGCEHRGHQTVPQSQAHGQRAVSDLSLIHI